MRSNLQENQLTTKPLSGTSRRGLNFCHAPVFSKNLCSFDDTGDPNPASRTNWSIRARKTRSFHSTINRRLAKISFLRDLSRLGATLVSKSPFQPSPLNRWNPEPTLLVQNGQALPIFSARAR